MFADQQRLTRWQPSDWPVADDWHDCVAAFFSGPAGERLGRLMQDRIDAGAVVYPSMPLRALQLTPCSGVQVVILGQDPYHGPGQANGMAFSVAPGIAVPPSLRNMYAEIDREYRPGSATARELARPPRNGDLSGWATQGVLLLNSVLSVEEGCPGSHAKFGWEVLTDEIIKQILNQDRPVVCMLWGLQAQRKSVLIDNHSRRSPVLLLQANHPSPLSARRAPTPFLGCGHFARANQFLRQHGAAGINW